MLSDVLMVTVFPAYMFVMEMMIVKMVLMRVMRDSATRESVILTRSSHARLINNGIGRIGS